MGKGTVEEAREQFGEISSAYLVGRPAPYAEQIQIRWNLILIK